MKIRRQRVRPHEYSIGETETRIVCYGMMGQVTGEIVVDTDRLVDVSSHKWCIKMRRGLPVAAIVSSGSRKNERMHHVLFGKAQDGFECDHKNRNPIDNREDNVRKITTAQNRWNTGLSRANTTGLKGVVKHRSGWVAMICHESKSVYIGIYPTKEEASVAYNDKARELRGSFSLGNLISESDQAIARARMEAMVRGKRRDNRSGYRGVSFNSKTAKWACEITKNGRKYFLGYYTDKDVAARVYNVKSAELYGANGFINTIVEA